MDIEQHYLRSMLQQMREPPLEPVEGEGGAAFGVFPAMRSAASRTGEKSEAATMLPADVAAGFGKGLITGGVGMAGDIVSIFNGIRSIFARGGDQDVVEAFLQGLEGKTILPTSEDVDKFVTEYLGPVVPKDAPMAKQRAGVAQAGQFAGEIVSGPGALIKGGKAAAKTAVKTAKFIKPKVGEMLSDYMSRSGMAPELMAYHGTPHTFAPEPGAPMGRFRAEKIGSGESNQAFGYGLYFAENPKVAGTYRSELSALYGASTKVEGAGQSVEIPLWVANKIENEGIGSVIKEWTDRLEEIKASIPNSTQPWIAEGNAMRFESQLKAFKEIEKAGKGKVQKAGSLYTVDIPDEMVGKMLDWDKPLSEQTSGIQAFFANVKNPPSADEPIGPWLQSRFREGADVTWAQDMQKAGIPGIRYLDRSSRAGGEGTRNIVVFPGGEDQVKIIKVE